jgi:hypothetical protein
MKSVVVTFFALSAAVAGAHAAPVEIRFEVANSGSTGAMAPHFRLVMSEGEGSGAGYSFIHGATIPSAMMQDSFASGRVLGLAQRYQRESGLAENLGVLWGGAQGLIAGGEPDVRIGFGAEELTIEFELFGGRGHQDIDGGLKPGELRLTFEASELGAVTIRETTAGNPGVAAVPLPGPFTAGLVGIGLVCATARRRRLGQ